MKKALYPLLGVWLMTTSAWSMPPDFDSLWNYDDPQGTEAKFRALLPAAEASPERAYHAELLTQIARTLGLQRQFDSAHAVLDGVAEMLPGLGARPRVRYLLERGRTLNSSGKPEQATAPFLEAWNLARDSALDFFAVDAAHMLAIIAPQAEQMAWNEKAVALAEASNDPKARGWLGSLYNNMGWTCFDAKDYDSALTLFEAALEFRIAQKQPAQIRIARWCVAKTWRYLGRADEALEAQRALEEEIAAGAGDQDGFVFEEIAECLLALNRGDEAKPYFLKAWKSLSADPWLAEGEPERLERLRRLGEGS